VFKRGDRVRVTQESVSDSSGEIACGDEGIWDDPDTDTRIPWVLFDDGRRRVIKRDCLEKVGASVEITLRYGTVSLAAELSERSAKALLLGFAELVSE